MEAYAICGVGAGFTDKINQNVEKTPDANGLKQSKDVPLNPFV